MSWSINVTGTPDEIVKLLDSHLSTITDPQSRAEYREALPVLMALVSLNFGTETKVFRLTANGHGTGIHHRQVAVTLSEWDKLI